MRRIALFALILILAAASPAVALEVRATLWGFNGQVVPNRFNILSVLVENDTARPFDGDLRARRVDFGRAVGPWIVEPCYLVPFTSRWVQFQIFIEEPEETWRLAWGDGPRETADVPVARFGMPAVVLLAPQEGRADAGGQLKRFPEELFPTSVTATDGLRAVALDHVPKWEEARRRAFLDWVRLGGLVHVGRDSFGEYPQFGDDLAALGAEGRVGLGRVVRHELPAREINEEMLERAGFPPAKFRDGPQAAAWSAGSIMDEVMRNLNEVSKPRHNWLVIFSCAGVYLLLIGPVNWFVGRKMEYRRVYIYFIAVVLGCSMLMLFMGQRGRRRPERIYTITAARALGGGQYALRQWSTLFTTRGADYTVAHPAEAAGSVYATPGVRTQPAQGAICNGRGGKLLVDIPINSSRFIMHCAKTPGKEWPVEASGWSSGDPTELSAGGTLPPDILWAYAVADGKWIRLQEEAGRLRGTRGPTDFPGGFGRDLYIGRPYDERNADQQAEQLLRSSALAIMAEAAGAAEMFYKPIVDPLRPTRHIFIACKGGGEFDLAPNKLGPERNIVIYHYSFYSTEN